MLISYHPVRKVYHIHQLIETPIVFHLPGQAQEYTLDPSTEIGSQIKSHEKSDKKQPDLPSSDYTGEIFQQPKKAW